MMTSFVRRRAWSLASLIPLGAHEKEQRTRICFFFEDSISFFTEYVVLNFYFIDLPWQLTELENMETAIVIWVMCLACCLHLVHANG